MDLDGVAEELLNQGGVERCRSEQIVEESSVVWSVLAVFVDACLV